MSDLFNLPPSDSPRLAWIKKHGLFLESRPIATDPEEEAGEAAYSHTCCSPGGTVGYGNSEADAIADWARKTKTPLWNEEGFASRH